MAAKEILEWTGILILLALLIVISAIGFREIYKKTKKDE